jgi:hypothetical protein
MNAAQSSSARENSARPPLERVTLKMKEVLVTDIWAEGETFFGQRIREIEPKMGFDNRPLIYIAFVTQGSGYLASAEKFVTVFR